MRWVENDNARPLNPPDEHYSPLMKSRWIYLRLIFDEIQRYDFTV